MNRRMANLPNYESLMDRIKQEVPEPILKRWKDQAHVAYLECEQTQLRMVEFQSGYVQQQYWMWRRNGE